VAGAAQSGKPEAAAAWMCDAGLWAALAAWAAGG
jgi:hypothetical protein